MNFYIDFEATQFTEEIISIGCVSENDQKFYRLVKPHDMKKLTKFITELTGITTEMLESDGVSADDAFLELRDFVQANLPEGELPTYYCYGDSDKKFIIKTMHYMKTFDAMVFASSVHCLLADYSKEVKRYFSVQGLALRKLVTLIRHESEVIHQDHDALEDAFMLKECFGRLEEINRTDCNTKAVMNTPSPKIKKQQRLDLGPELPRIPKKEILPPITQELRNRLTTLRTETWKGMNQDNCMGDATAETGKVKLTDVYSGTARYFSCPHAAALYLNMMVRSCRSTKNMDILSNTVVEMFASPNNFCKYRCELINQKTEAKEQ